jgi:hypothetical protein
VGKRRVAVENVQIHQVVLVLGHDLLGVQVDDLILGGAGVDVQPHLLDDGVQVRLLDDHLDAGHLFKLLDVGRDGGGRRGVLGDEVEGGAGKLLPVKALGRLNLGQALHPALKGASASAASADAPRDAAGSIVSSRSNARMVASDFFMGHPPFN